MRPGVYVRWDAQMVGSSQNTSGYPIDLSIRWNIVVSEFHLIDGFKIGRCNPFFKVLGHLVFWTWTRATYIPGPSALEHVVCLLVHNILLLPIDLVHSSRCSRSLFYTSLELPDWTNQIWQFRELVHMYMHSVPIFNVDPAVMSI